MFESKDQNTITKHAPQCAQCLQLAVLLVFGCTILYEHIKLHYMDVVMKTEAIVQQKKMLVMEEQLKKHERLLAITHSIKQMKDQVVKRRNKREVSINEGDKLLGVLLASVSFYERKTGRKTLDHLCLNKTVIFLPGVKGDKGYPGVIGHIGPKGMKGDEGKEGKGNTGKSGPMGPKGEKGFIGRPGIKGDIGDQGLIGLPGMKGIKGAKGSTGRSIEKPIIISAPVEQTVLETGDATFTCKSKGNPEPKIEWHFHGRPVDKKRYSYPTATGIMIEKVQFKDKGKITCLYRNILGEVNATAELIVWVKPQIKLATRITAYERTNATVNCQTSGYPKPKISWKRLDAPLSSNVIYERENSVMIIPKIATESSGIYTCMAANKAGLAEERTILLVKGWMDIMLHSEGCDDKGITGCGRAKIEINGKNILQSGRGHNVAIINYQTGQLISVASFDTYGDKQAGVKLKAYIEGASTDSIIAVAVQDSANLYLSQAIPALKSIGAKNASTTLRSSYALLGYKGTKGVNWISEMYHERYKGPSVIRIGVELGKYV